MTREQDFDLQDFLPYLLNMAAEECSLAFQRYYKDRYGMLRQEWRVLFHLGRYGEMTATEISRRARLHKTRISRAVAALESRGMVSRDRLENDRRAEILRLTRAGRAAYDDLSAEAAAYNARLLEPLAAEEREILTGMLRRLAAIDRGAG
jgi:DNA-binding MarR family transcriptional regulator